MHFQVRTDNHIANSEDLSERIRAEVEGTFQPRFADRIRRVEVYLQDMNANKKGVDTRCSIEVSVAGHPPLGVEDRATTVEDAVTGAVDKAFRALEHMLDRIDDRSDRVSMSGEQT